MTDIVVLAEESSGRIIAENLAATLGFAERTLCLQHQGKGDLQRSFPRKIGSWGSFQPPRFIVMHDNDGANCESLKGKLLGLVPRDAISRVKVRLVIQELESWYLGDLRAVGRAGLLSESELSKHRGKSRYRDPDGIRHAKREFKSKIAQGGQIELARRIGPHLSVTENRSQSFHMFVSALKWAAGKLAAT
jgi:hypothetical protein